VVSGQLSAVPWLDGNEKTSDDEAVWDCASTGAALGDTGSREGRFAEIHVRHAVCTADRIDLEALLIFWASRWMTGNRCVRHLGGQAAQQYDWVAGAGADCQRDAKAHAQDESHLARLQAGITNTFAERRMSFG
jgi:hypothetical protein